ncbi:hypothetical protein FNH22_24825 [Fulvivirga sp. M361]|uniref:hypothetical protein n=1 Tax=Fulvivirga sp. M361 TaxID=2594266 RepID=UPI00117BBC04|nr:hypothetical protein [Fulvivirga sp. M361]TRX50879.1 hypothetical protein FNH22_24825 [Fulvivirga sp. M361]
MLFLNFILLLVFSCSDDNSNDSGDDRQDRKQHADITAVRASGSNGSYTFSVTLSSPDTGCDQYADWWEVLSEDGKLVYRRILAHSHVNEQPFARSGGPVGIDENQTVWIRGHMNTTGYGGQAFKGSVATGFEAAELPDPFATGVDSQSPLPGNCAF